MVTVRRETAARKRGSLWQSEAERQWVRQSEEERHGKAERGRETLGETERQWVRQSEEERHGKTERSRETVGERENQSG